MSEEPEYPEVYKVIGAPGTGKTTRVVGNPELELDGLFIENGDTYSLDEQMLVTYTNAGVDEAADRLKNMLDAPKYKIDERITTIHSQCYSTLNDFGGFDGLEREQVVDHWNKKNFCDAHGLDFGWDDDEDDMMGADMEQGNALFRIYDWCQNNRVPLEDWDECPAEWDWREDPADLMTKWVQWKKDRGLIGFGDMIEKVVELGRKQVTNLGWGPLFVDDDMDTIELFEKARDDPDRDPSVIRDKGAFVDTKVLYVDEVQDLTPLQWCWYLLQKLACEKVYIGGDDDQTIYGWAGANPEFMLNEEGEFEVLDRTYRIPEKVWNTCDGVIQQVDTRQEKEVTPDGDGGEVVTYRAPSPRQIIQHITDGEVMILFRARYQIDEFRNTLHEYGIPYDNMSTFDTWDGLVDLRDALAKIENDAPSINGDELRALKEYAEDYMIRDDGNLSETETVMGQFGGISMDRLDEIFNVPGPYGSHDLSAENYLRETEELNYYEKEALKGNIKSGNTDLYPERVRIGTIHSSKGKEAETVVLATDSTQTILDNMAEEVMESEDGVGIGPVPVTDAERRVYYVGMTRASQKLVLAQGIINPDMCIDLDQLLAEDQEAGDWESGRQSHTAEWD